jgi:hypothetical protein
MIVLFQPGVDYDLSLFNCREPFGTEFQNQIVANGMHPMCI